MTPATLLKRLLFVVMAIAEIHAFAQEDSVRMLDEITVKAFGANRSPREIPASIEAIPAQSFNRFSATSLLPAFNMLPGIRMEERSPGSYRFSVRGSLLRSPFGVRNVKFYWNGLPLTDGGGNTYLNLIDLQSIGTAEVILGPASSLYGAGTGGAVLLRSPNLAGFSVGLGTQYGTYGAFRIGGDLVAASDIISSRVQFVRQRSDGYRAQSGFERNAFQADMLFLLGSSDLIQVVILQSDLMYQTPGGLTEEQLQADPRQARPPSTTSPGTAEQKAAVYNNTLFTGVNFEHEWTKSWRSTLGISGSDTDFSNPAIRNYETRREKNVSARLTTAYEMPGPEQGVNVIAGGEYQRYTSPIVVRNNDAGNPGSIIISQDDVTAVQAMAFVHGEIEFAKTWQAVAGVSLNYVEYDDTRTVPAPASGNRQSFNPELMPRMAVMKEISPLLNAYASISRGFSPPTVAEVLPSTGIYNPGLLPESGWSYEVGLNGKLFDAIDYHLALYDFRLVNTIVLQRDSSGADYYVNAGDTKQQGVELSTSWSHEYSSFIQHLRITSSVTYNHFRFGTYVNDGMDHSGNQLTGVPPWVVAIGADVTTRKGYYLQVSANYADRIPLNDANTDYAAGYFLLSARTGLRVAGRLPLDLYFGVDNALGTAYSLGNDLNAAGKRYFNAAPTANYYAGISARLPLK